MDLNDSQQEAVLYDSGPLLIIAGAGTGKTRVITEKILHLLNNCGLKSGEILALTFTEKAANEMVGRVEDQLPLGYEELMIKTFHSFAGQLLRDSGMEIGIDPGFRLLTQVEEWFFFKEHLFDFELDYYRPLGNPNSFVYAILNHFSKLKDELVMPDEYLAYAQKLDGEEAEKVLEIAKAYGRFQELLIEANCLTFADLSFYANRLLSARKSVLKKYRDQFKHIMVDEFQDTNHAQFQLVLKLAGSAVTVVGDDDQSIYKWRGASLSNILQFEEFFPGAKKIVLTENYRSSASILDSAYQLIQGNNPDRLEERMGISKRLNCNTDFAEPVEVHEFADFLQEAAFVAEKIKFLHENEQFSFGNFAILVRANQHAHPFIDELKKAGIPFQVKNPKGLFSLEEIKDLICVVRVLADPRDDVSLLRMLKMDLFGVDMPEILRLLHNGAKSDLFHAIKPKEVSLPGIEDGVARLYDLLQHLLEFSRKQPVGIVINEFLEKSGYLKNLIDADRFGELENINEFARQVSKFERETERKTVVDFVNYLDLLEEANAVFSTDSFTDRDSVQILTAHGSKGLEFDCVFVCDAVKQRFPATRRSEPLEVPDELTREIYPEGDFHIQEERRLFYVAMTRARRRLFLTYSGRYEGSKQWKQSPFVTEILEGGQAMMVRHEPDDDAIARLKTFMEPSKPLLTPLTFTGSKLSYSQFDTFQTCPLKYNYRHLMKVPTKDYHAANFGSSVHKTLNDFYCAMKSGTDISPGLLREIYERNWIPYGYESRDHEAERKRKGLEIMENFYQQNCSPWIVPAFLERHFNVKVGQYWINGRIDRIDRLADGSYEVIDYKTGRVKDGYKAEKDLQLSLYALACRDVLGLNVSKLSLYFIETNEKVSTSRSNEQIDALHTEIETLIEEIKQSDFAATPGHHCRYCDYRLICPAV